MRIESDFLAASDPLPAIEALCIAIAERDPVNNPCGLFCHPLTEAETTLVVGADAMLHQAELAQLVEALYISCNYPLHIRVETRATQPVTPSLAEQVGRYLKPQAEGGYMDDSRPTPSWEWRCDTGETLDSAALETYRAAGGSVTLIRS
ncbi:hypothetical protein QKW35_04985 [Pontibacterium granulatum]|uniref:hypothetical protein n=1 Tax=Pontibacterium granulatum TaxID=2036029 RepID=UPI00249C8726|nr:hypothetical protein [Pontibacterium granulatum]MDI3323728.1 hypothetical protein [Pontibacterium granulatum]